MIVTIPTCRSRDEVAPLVCDVEGMSYPVPVYASCRPLSAAANRNDCLRHAEKHDIIIMVDDDIRGFYRGWAEKLTANLAAPGVVVASARLMDRDGGYGPMMGMEGKGDEGRVEVSYMPTACIAFRLEDVPDFNEEFRGSGYEDSYWCWCIRKRYPERKFIVDNGVKLIHLNERKGQDRDQEHNRKLFETLTGGGK